MKKINWLKKFEIGKFSFINIAKIASLNKDAIVYSFIFTFLIFLFFIINFTNKRIDENQLVVRKNLVTSEEFQIIKKFIISKIRTPYTNINYEVKTGDTLKKILKNYKINNSDIDKSIKEYKKHAKASNIVNGIKINLIIKKSDSSKENLLQRLSVPISKSSTVDISRNEQGNLISEKIITQLFKKIRLVDNDIQASLYKSALESKIEPNIIVEFARIFGFEIDFQRDIRKNDRFQILYEQMYDDNDKLIKTGSIIYAFMSVNNREISLYKFGEDENYSYFDINGKSVVKALMKTPINGARLSSPFGMRKHPILGFNKMHKGTDFAAPAGTPVMASGSGTVVKAKWCGGGGNCIKIKHNSTYTTIYAHLKNFAKGIKSGKKVKQGQIIGYVGSTGMSTGPHLHYEVLVNGKQVNSQKLKLPSGKVLKEEERKKFEVERIKTDVLIAEILAKNYIE